MSLLVERFGPVRVATEKEAVLAYRGETGWLSENGDVPLCFPVVWMKIPVIGDLVRAAAQEVGLPIHEAQYFEYLEPLMLDQHYDLILEMKREKNPARLVAHAEILTTGGQRVGTVISVLRLIVPPTISFSRDPA
jgi:hypothetical protein